MRSVFNVKLKDLDFTLQTSLIKKLVETVLSPNVKLVMSNLAVYFPLFYLEHINLSFSTKQHWVTFR